MKGSYLGIVEDQTISFEEEAIAIAKASLDDKITKLRRLSLLPRFFSRFSKPKLIFGNMKKWVQHGLFWLVLYILWSYMKSSGTFWRPVLYVNLLNVAIYMFAFYFLRHFQLPRLYNPGKYVLFGLSLFACSVLFYVLWRSLGVLYSDALYYPSRELPLFKMSDYLTQSVQFYSPAILLLAWESYHERMREKLRNEQLEKEKMANELKFLKAQINPHFLFNSLNNLYSFVLNQSPKAPDLILRLSGMLDFILYKSQKPTVSLQEEISCIEDYLELEKMRYGDRLAVTFETQGDLRTLVSPLLLLSVVENAFKHGASGDAESPEIKIKIKADGKSVNCVVWNTKSQLEGELNDAYKEGIGLSNIKRQLQLTYPDGHTIKIQNEQDTFRVTIEIVLPKQKD